jgi:hypothetical protein
MKKPSFKILLLLMTTAMAAETLRAQQPEDVTAAKQQYEEMKAQVSGGDLKLDWRAFRVAAATSGLRAGFATRTDYNEAIGETEAGKLDAALAASEVAIDRNMADPEAHLLAARVLEKMGRWSEAETEHTIESALIKSIFDSGDGKSATTAWFVVTPAEENFFIKTSLGEQPTSHTPTSQNGQTLDKVTAVDWAKVSHDTWFIMPVSTAPGSDGKKEE